MSLVLPETCSSWSTLARLGTNMISALCTLRLGVWMVGLPRLSKTLFTVLCTTGLVLWLGGKMGNMISALCPLRMVGLPRLSMTVSTVLCTTGLVLWVGGRMGVVVATNMWKQGSWLARLVLFDGVSIAIVRNLK